ncbi:MAG: ACP S-malonyltransferase [Frisingicoccus sp.]
MWKRLTACHSCTGWWKRLKNLMRRGMVEIANDNARRVISGEAEAVRLAGEAMKAAGAKRVAMLNVSGPFHSSMLKGAGERLEPELQRVRWLDSDIPYVSNTIAELIGDKEKITPLLVRQVSESVRWQQNMKVMIDMGVEVFVEIGPKTLDLPAHVEKSMFGGQNMAEGRR